MRDKLPEGSCIYMFLFNLFSLKLTNENCCYSSEKIEPITFEFGNTLLADYQGNLENNKLSVTDLTTADMQTK